MSWSIPILRVAGIQLRIHITFLLLIGWLAVGSAGAAIFVLLLFFCVVLLEFGHAIAAKGYGINTPDITLLPIGGVARLERMPEEPKQELVIAIAGPLVNVIIAACLYVVIGARGHVGPETRFAAAICWSVCFRSMFGWYCSTCCRPFQWTAGGCCGRYSPRDSATHAQPRSRPASARALRSYLDLSVFSRIHFCFSSPCSFTSVRPRKRRWPKCATYPGGFRSRARWSVSFGRFRRARPSRKRSMHCSRRRNTIFPCLMNPETSPAF